MGDARGGTQTLGWFSLSLLLLAAASFAVPLGLYVRATSNAGVPVGAVPVEIHAAGDRTWGVYFNDLDNSGYSESCTVTDPTGRPIALRDPGVTLSGSETEMLDHVFETPGSGHFTIACRVEGADARVGPVGSLRSLLIGVAGAVLLGLGGLIAGTVWLIRRLSIPEVVSAEQRPESG